MVDRLANVIYWVACLLALGAIGLGVAIANEGHTNSTGAIAGCAIVAFAIWLVGRGIRYVLAGK